MAGEIFVDTSGFYALLVKRDEQHAIASRILHQSAGQHRRFVTSDYVLDETFTLLKARGHRRVIGAFADSVFKSKACRVEWIDSARFSATIEFFLKRLDQEWSFTDCVSFRLMTELRLHEALTKDAHFEAAGFVALLKN
ncbi:MAG: type II toxin-antitoxin system VapC family toxin [Candidatus Competibacteraceae bacterium]|nr:type II toxin-antitoxin system VapC family toxin [Candidatus Competibacteraceae bacterium]